MTNRRLPLLLLYSTTACFAFQTAAPADIARWQQEANKVIIVRDDWGIAHIHGKSDADAVFGMIYTQAEDDFPRIETNYINAMGRLAEAEGESKIYQDLRMKLLVDPADLRKKYGESPAWLQTLMNAFADGLNYYLFNHPQVKPRVIQHFEPWMALSFTEGSIGGDIERINLEQLQAFYGRELAPQTSSIRLSPTQYEPEPSGSNGVAIAPSNTATHHALLLINPHTSFFFRSELQMASDEGLDAYGAVTWGQFFVYQGFNARAGWMHTSSGVDAFDEYLEAVQKKGDRFVYKNGNEEWPVMAEHITVPYKTATGMAEKRFAIYRTHHGPVVREADGRWVSVRLMQEPIKALMQSYSRTKATDYKSYLTTMELKANSSNNTIFADADGDIAYFHGNFIPKRDASFDWTKPVDGSNPATEWKGLLSIDETPHLLNPQTGWLYNSNNWPWSAAGASSPKKENYPAYVETGTESARGLHAIRLLSGKKDFTLDSLIAAAYDSYLTWFDKPLPALIKAWDALPTESPLKQELREQAELLRAWDRRWSAASVPTTLAIFWGDDIRHHVEAEAKKEKMSIDEFIAERTPSGQLLASLAVATSQLTAEFGSWKTSWGTINRFQRLTGELVQPFTDLAPSIPVGFTSSFWGSLASFGAHPYPGTKNWYGSSGNSFVAVVEFGDRVRAKAVSAGGESGNPASPHFNDQAKRYATGDLRDVYFYPEQLRGHVERTYHPGQ